MEKEEFQIKSAGHITRGQRKYRKLKEERLIIISNPFHHKADLESLNTGVYYMRCFVECEFQEYNFCTYLTGHCMIEENFGKVKGERIILK